MTSISSYQLEKNLRVFIDDYEKCMINVEMNSQNKKLTEDVFESLFRMDFGDAERICLQASDREDKLVSLTLLGLTYYLMCKITAAVEVIDEVLAVNNDFIPALNLASDILYITKRFEEAETALIKSISLDESQRHPRIFLAELYRTTGRQVKALSILEGLCRDLPEDAVAWSMLCEIHDEMGTIQTAEDLLRAEIRKRENNFGAWHNLGVIYHNQFRFEDAENALLKAIGIYSGNTNTLFTLGNVYKMTGRPHEAVDTFKKVLATDSDDSRALFELSGLLYLQGKQDEARTIFEKAVKLNPSLKEGSIVFGF